MNRETWERLRTDFGNLHRAIPDFTVGPLRGVDTIEYHVTPSNHADILNAFTLMTRAGKLLEEVPDELLFPDDPDACERIREAKGSERWIKFIGSFNAEYLSRYGAMSVGAASTAAIDMLLIRLQNQASEEVSPEEKTEEAGGDTTHAGASDQVPTVDNAQSLPPALDEDDLATLKAFAEQIGSLIDLTRLRQILAHTVRHPISHKTLVAIVNRLIVLKLVHRPKGERQGAALTDKGYERLRLHIAKQAKQAKGN